MGKYAAVIHVTEFRESCKRAMFTVLRFSRYFSSIHLVSETVTFGDNLYPGWKNDHNTLKQKRMQLHHHTTTLDMKKVTEYVIVHIPPTCMFEEAPFKLLTQRLNRIRKTDQPRHAIVPVTDLNMHGFSIWYLFLALMCIVDWWRDVFAWFTLYEPEYHIIAEEILHGHCRTLRHHYRSTPWRCCSPFSFISWCWPKSNMYRGYAKHHATTQPQSTVSDRSPAIYVSSGVVCSPTRRVSGMTYFLYRMHTRNTFGPGWKLWLVIVLCLYLALGFSWWAPLGIWSWRLIMRVLAFLTRDDGFVEGAGEWLAVWVQPFGIVRLALVGISWLIHTSILVRRFRWRHKFWVALTFPFTIPLLFPWILIWARLYQSHGAWETQLDPDDDYMDTPWQNFNRAQNVNRVQNQKGAQKSKSASHRTIAKGTFGGDDDDDMLDDDDDVE